MGSLGVGRRSLCGRVVLGGGSVARPSKHPSTAAPHRTEQSTCQTGRGSSSESACRGSEKAASLLPRRRTHSSSRPASTHSWRVCSSSSSAAYWCKALGSSDPRRISCPELQTLRLLASAWPSLARSLRPSTRTRSCHSSASIILRIIKP